ncbi:hypothetical protein BDF22DRAFT_657815 [Syncephalis plumigaleata]|nr:hypothetical protein BDF22DRAFT_657815 [Syncephalis plumigaleata]
MSKLKLLCFTLILLGWCLTVAVAQHDLHRRNLFARSPQNSDTSNARSSANTSSNNNNNNNNNNKQNGNDGDSDNTKSKDSSKAPPKDEPAGRLIMEQPSLTMGEVPRYAIGSNVTFKWKYDENLRVAPRYLAFEITRDRRQYFTIANISYEPTTYTWNTANWTDETQTFTLSEDRYYLFISDERGRDGNGSSLGGHLSPYTSTYFYMYNPSSGICMRA